MEYQAFCMIYTMIIMGIGAAIGWWQCSKYHSDDNWVECDRTVQKEEI